MITVQLEKPLPFEENGTRVDVRAFDIRPPLWADEKAIRKESHNSGVDFDAVMKRLAEPIGVTAPIVTQAMLDGLSVWDVTKLQDAYTPFFSHPDTLSPEQRAAYGLSEKRS